jgi:hypothetical protein
MLSSLFDIGFIKVMDVHEYIEIHPKDCGGWIIVMDFKVLLIMQILIREILVETVLGIYARDVKIKIFSIQML